MSAPTPAGTAAGMAIVAQAPSQADTTKGSVGTLACSVASASQEKYPSPQTRAIVEDLAQDLAVLTHSASLGAFPNGNCGSRPALTPPRGRVVPGVQQARVSAVTPRSGGTAEGGPTPPPAVWRRDLERLEARLAAQVGSARDAAAAALEKSERLQQAALHRVDHRVITQEGTISKLDRKVSELVGAVRGLSDEMQALVRRIDAADTRAFNVRRELEEELRQKIQEQTHSHQETLSKYRVLSLSCEETQKRLSQTVRRLETTLHEHSLRHEDVGQAVADLHERLEVVVARQGELEVFAAPNVAATASSGKAADVSSEAVTRIEARMLDTVQKVERLRSEAYGDNGWSARLEEHEVRLAGMRSKIDSANEQRSVYDTAVREELEGKLEQIRKMMQVSSGSTLQQHEDLQVLATALRCTDQATEDLRRDLEQARVWAAQGAAANEDSPQSGARFCLEREEVDETNLLQHINTLVHHVKAVVPKVIEHDRTLLEVQALLQPGGQPASGESTKRSAEFKDAHGEPAAAHQGGGAQEAYGGVSFGAHAMAAPTDDRLPPQLKGRAFTVDRLEVP
uniref:Uncharacterized protein n=1 Tax=Alexandrium monilatum TaxID=311494 RepID=A0A7S4T3P1_9DINO